MRLEINMTEFINLVKNNFLDSEIKNIVEIGSLDGKDSLLFKSNFPNANVYCIEGLSDNYNTYLKDFVEVTPINIVVSDYDGEIVFHKKNVNGIHGILNRGDEYGTNTLVLKCMTMETICKTNNIESLDMLKIDVEGASYQVLKGIGKMLNTIKIMHIETESYPFFKGQILHGDVVNFLETNGFTMIDMTSVNISAGYQHDSVWLNNKYKK